MPQQKILLEESLTKENFWNDIEAKYPKAFRYFADWIDAYKRAINWGKLFNECFYTQEQVGGLFIDNKAPKFHDLPHAMQLGIWFAFVTDRGGCQYPIEDMFEFDLRKDIEEYMKLIEIDFPLIEI